MAESADHLDPEAHADETRRAFVVGVAVGATVVGAVAAVPILRLLSSPLERTAGGELWVSLGSTDQFSEERREVIYSFPHKDGWYTANQTKRVVVGKDGDEYVVLSTVCTHLGCGVNWMADEKKFFCPCHSGEFNADGSVKAGPPRKPLVRLEARVRNGQLEVKES